ncbi:DUF456 domain-containing protein [Nocardioides bigeumensis]|uniref:DUF456 domain-containing protein n=1 Tax=Nocardioides bigeumensis TaxID=433657 RepID=A0ABP5JN80_9ACTN
MTLVELFVALAIVVGLIGILVPVLPGTILIMGAILIWAIDTTGATAWAVFAVATTVLAAGTLVKYLVPGRQLKATVPTSTLLVGGVLAVVGFFVIPVVGIFVGFPLGVYAAERQRVGAEQAWPSTKAALRALGVSILIELAAGAVATAVWLTGVVLT